MSYIPGSAAVEDILRVEHACGDDLATMKRTPRYDYRAQRWIEGADHAHYVGATLQEADTAPLLFCGADLETCEGTK